jgi:hypothetical protein
MGFARQVVNVDLDLIEALRNQRQTHQQVNLDARATPPRQKRP